MQLDKSYKKFILEFKQKIYNSKTKAILSANRLMIELYFDIGREIVNKQEKDGWGKSVVEEMSKDLRAEFGEKSGYSTQNLWYMRQFYNTYKIIQISNSLLEKFLGESNILIFSKCKDNSEREYYINNTIQFGWNRNVLIRNDKTRGF